ncbi:hypothetical protein HDU67_010346 [Dinochytrium kinnereticum]|nr:hypothetical protein HDU67_010346 [Dinochytrium kinnereticum]
MEDNVGSFSLHDRWLCITDGESPKPKQFNFIDIPGHDKLRFKLVDNLPKAKAILFVIDASTFQKKVRNIAELLADVLGDRGVAKDEIPVLVLCNKADSLLSTSKDRVKAALELELDRIRATRTAGVDNQTGDGATDWEYIGLEGTTFSFDQLGNKIQFIELSLKEIAETKPERDGENKELVDLLLFLVNEA